MSKPLFLRDLSDDEAHALRAMAQSHTVEARLRDRARLCWQSHEGHSVPAIARTVGIHPKTVRRWITAFNAAGMAGLHDAPRTGRPPIYTPEQIGTVVATSLIPPEELGLPFGSWTLDRLTAYLTEEHGITMKRSRIAEVLQAEGLRWRTQETWLGERVDPAFAEKRGPSSPSIRTRP